MDSMSVLRERFSSQVESHIGEYEAIFVADNLVLFSGYRTFFKRRQRMLFIRSTVLCMLHSL